MLCGRPLSCCAGVCKNNGVSLLVYYRSDFASESQCLVVRSCSCTLVCRWYLYYDMMAHAILLPRHGRAMGTLDEVPDDLPVSLDRRRLL